MKSNITNLVPSEFLYSILLEIDSTLQVYKIEVKRFLDLHNVHALGVVSHSIIGNAVICLFLILKWII